MNPVLAQKVYFFILESNGWTREEVLELHVDEYINDPIFEGLLKLEEE